MRRAIFIYNPVSGDHNISHKLNHIIGRFQDGGVLLQPYRLSSPDYSDLTEVIKQDDYSFVAAAGGDGTLNIVVNSMLKSGLDMPLGIIPSGTCNDFARSLNIPSNLNDCIDVILSGRTSRVDVGLVNGEQYFLNTCAGGLFVDVSFSTNSELKKNFGTFAYYLKAVSEVTNINPFKLELATDSETVKQQVLLFLILNGKHGAGFSNLVKEANVTDGLMDIILVKNCSHIDLAAIFFKVLSNEAMNDRNVTILQSKNCLIKGNKEVLTTVDGEKGPGLPLEIRFLNRMLGVFAPWRQAA